MCLLNCLKICCTLPCLINRSVDYNALFLVTCSAVVMTVGSWATCPYASSLGERANWLADGWVPLGICIFILDHGWNFFFIRILQIKAVSVNTQILLKKKR